MINLIKRQIRRLRGDHVVSAEMARLQDELAKQSDMIRQLVAGSFSNSFSNLGDAKNPGKQIVNLDSDSLISKLQPFMIKLLEEYARSEQYGHEKWNPEEMSVKSYLGQRGRSACEALEDLRWGDKLNIGPGATWSRPGWKTLDCYRSADIEMDLRKCKPFPVPDNSFSVIYTSHCLEHIDNASGMNVLNESYRALRPGGLMRVVVPDLAKALLAYEFRDFRWFLRSGMNLRGDNVEQLLVNWVASYAMRQPENGPVSYDGGPPINPEEVKEFIADMDSMEGFVEWCVTRIPSDSPYIAHVNGFYPEKLLKWFKDAGFRQVVFSNYRCSIMPELKEEGFDNHASASLFMEAIK